ncbi:hypothetical protein CTEN210_14927 [Chaetoceros tenuissimus]|uniref:Uncharacterized protein n=1 Tax=Chaetoceros tenuissimus TaxID=426638 RepID=A0AAD3D5W4_9STRA|nr:hypothetical protein CTEN210_14927 [Chaetoceros tenuissimus]
MKKKQLDKISADNSIVNTEAPMKEGPSRTSNACVVSIAASRSKKSETASAGSICSENNIEMAKDDLLDSSFLLRKESANSTLSASGYEKQLGTLINDPMLKSRKDEERNMKATSNHQQKTASSISNSRHARLNADHRTANSNPLTQQHHLQQLMSSYQQAVATYHVDVVHPMISRVEEDTTKHQHIDVQNILQDEAEAESTCNSTSISNPEVLECDDSLKACLGTNTIHVELPSKPIRFLKANDEEGYKKVKEIIEGMVDRGIQQPGIEFYEKYPDLTSKYEKQSLVKGISYFSTKYKAKKASFPGRKDSSSTVHDDASKHHDVKNAALQNEAQTQSSFDASMGLNEERTVPEKVNASLKSSHLLNIYDSDQDYSATLPKEREKIHDMAERSIQPNHANTEFQFAKKDTTATTNSPQRLTAIAEKVRSSKAKKAATEWKEQSISHPQDEARKRLLIPFKKWNDEEGYMKVKEIIEGMMDEGIQHPASKFYKKYPELTSKYEKQSLSHGISRFCTNHIAKKNALLPQNKDSSSPIEDDASKHPHIDDSLKACLGTDPVHVELPSKPIHFTKANDEEGYMKVKRIIEGMVDKGIQQPGIEFYEKYPDLTSKYERKSLTNRISTFSTKYKAKKDALLGRKDSSSTVHDDVSNHQQMEVKDATLQDEGDIQTSCDAAMRLNEQNTMEKSSQLENIHYSDQDYSATLPKEREEDHDIAEKSIQPNHTNTEYQFANTFIEEQHAIMSTIKLSAKTTNHSPQQLASTSTDVMNVSDDQGDAKSMCDSTNLEQTFKPIHFKKTKDEVGFLKVKEIIHGMMDEGVEDPQKEFFKKHPSLANKYEKGSIRRGVHSFCRNYNIKKANEEKKKQSLLLVQEKQGMLHAKAKIGLEKYCSSLKTSVSSPEVEGKIQADDKTKLEGAIDETLQWLDSNHFAEKEEFEEKQNTLEAIAAPLFEYLKALDTKKCVVNEDTNFTHQYADENALSEQSKPIQITEFDKFLEDKAKSLAEWILVEIIKINSANVRSKCKEYADELIKLGFYDKEMMKNFCTVEIIDSEDFTSFMKLAHRLSLKKWLLEHGASK